MGSCQICNCPKEDSESGQIVFPFIKRITLFSDEFLNCLNDEEDNKNINPFSNHVTFEKDTCDHIKLTKTEKKKV